MDDAFKRLEELVGAPVESVGEGLPQTRAEAKARGVLRYFTGKPCKHGHVDNRLTSSGSCHGCDLLKSRGQNRKEYNIKWQSENAEKLREARRMRYEEHKQIILNANRKYREKNKDAVKLTFSKYYEKNKEKIRARTSEWAINNYDKKQSNDRRRVENRSVCPELFAINQAEYYSVKGEVPRDITANCPEPTRSKLQALVNQIKADPSAGKQVVGLLRNMRELRKLELAEMKQVTEETKE